MNVQYITNNSGDTTAVVIPIEDWNMLKNKYGELAREEAESFEIPQWQKALGKEEVRSIDKKVTDLLDWDESKKQFKI